MVGQGLGKPLFLARRASSSRRACPFFIFPLRWAKKSLKLSTGVVITGSQEGSLESHKLQYFIELSDFRGIGPFLALGNAGKEQAMSLEQNRVPKASYQALQVSDQPAESPGQYPKTGLALSIQGESKEALAATVVEGTPDEIWLELARPISPLPFRKGERVRLRYWDEGSIAYYWDAKVIKIIGDASQHVALGARSEGVTVQRRRSYRIHAQIPLFFTVIDAADSQLIGEHCADCKTQNISAGGLAFETHLPLKVGDKLAVQVRFHRSRQIDVVGWILRSEPVEREGECLNSVAFEFLQCEPQDQNQLLQFLARAEVKNKGN